MILSPLLLLALPLAAARPHLPGAGADLRRREHHARAAITDRPLVERAGGAISNETRDEISSWRHAHESDQQSTVTSASATSGVAGVGNALSAVSSAAESSATPTSAAQTQAPVSEADTASAAEPSVVEAASSQDAQPSTAEAAAASTSPSPSAETSAEVASSTSSSSRSSVTHTTVVTASRSSTVVRVTASSSASAAASNNNDEPEKIAGINKTTFIIIIVVAGVVALVAVGWTVFRKWKLRPSSRFDEKMRPIDFSPDNGADPIYMEKSHHMRTGSNSSAAMHRQELVAELDSKHVPGVPDHDFTAGGGNMAGHGAYDGYNQDPYAHAEAYEYDAAYHYDQRGYDHDQPTQDTGYADLQRGNSIGSGSGHGHGQQYPVESFPVADHYLSRPTAADGPYAASHRY